MSNLHRSTMTRSSCNDTASCRCSCGRELSDAVRLCPLCQRLHDNDASGEERRRSHRRMKNHHQQEDNGRRRRYNDDDDNTEKDFRSTTTTTRRRCSASSVVRWVSAKCSRTTITRRTTSFWPGALSTGLVLLILLLTLGRAVAAENTKNAVEGTAPNPASGKGKLTSIIIINDRRELT